MTKIKTKGQVEEADIYAGNILKTIRANRKISQKKLGNVANITFQQVQKYENGTNRMSFARVAQFAKFLDVDINVFCMNKGDSLKVNEIEILRICSDIKEDDLPALRLFIKIIKAYKNG